MSECFVACLLTADHYDRSIDNSVCITVMLKLVKNEEGYIFKGFLHAFKLNFKQSTIIWLILLLCGGVCFVDYRISEMMPGTLGMVFKSVFLLLAFFLISVTIYSFALTARYEIR